MMDPVAMFTEGGPFMYVVLVALVANQLGAVVLFATQLGRARLSASIWVLFASTPLLVGLVGTFISIGEGLSIVEHASAAMHSTMAGNALAVALYPTFFAAWCSALSLLGYALATGVALLIRPGKPARWTIGGAMVSLVVAAIVGVSGGLFSGLGAGLVGATTGFALFVGGLRFPKEEQADRARVVAGRASIGFYGVLAVGCVALASYTTSISSWYLAQSTSPAELKAGRMAEAVEWLPWSLGGLAGMAVVVSLVAALIVVPGLKDLGRRAGNSGVFAAFALLPVLAVLTGVQVRASELAEEARPILELRRAALRRHGLKLMDSPLKMDGLYPGYSYTVVGDRVLLEDEPAGLDSEPVVGRVAVEAAGGVLFSVVEPYLRERRAPVCLAVNHEGLACVWFWMLQPEDMDESAAIQARSTVGGWDVYVPGAQPEEWNQESRARWMGLQIEQVREAVLAASPGPDGRRILHVWLDPDANIADVVALISGTFLGEEGGEHDPVVRLSAGEAPRFPADEAVIEEGLQGEVGFDASVAAVVKHNRADIQRCYRVRLAKNPSLQGRVTLQINVGPGGQVINTRVGSSTLGDPKVEQCLVSLFRTVEFEAPGSIEVVRVPLNFSTN